MLVFHVEAMRMNLSAPDIAHMEKEVASVCVVMGNISARTELSNEQRVGALGAERDSVCGRIS